jgi:glucose 1-dehydrogenase
MMPTAMNPPIAPRKTTAIGTATPRPSSMGFSTLSMRATKRHQIRNKIAFFGTQLAARQMIKQGGSGRIINITSVHEDWPMPGNMAYCLSKGGMRMLTRTAGVELAPHDILVVGVGPGAIATPINVSTMENPTLLKKLNDAIPLGRMAKPEEIATVVAFLAGDGARCITATTIFADGGIMQSGPVSRMSRRYRPCRFVPVS